MQRLNYKLLYCFQFCSPWVFQQKHWHSYWTCPCKAALLQTLVPVTINKCDPKPQILHEPQYKFWNCSSFKSSNPIWSRACWDYWLELNLISIKGKFFKELATTSRASLLMASSVIITSKNLNYHTSVIALIQLNISLRQCLKSCFKIYNSVLKRKKKKNPAKTMNLTVKLQKKILYV